MTTIAELGADVRRFSALLDKGVDAMRGYAVEAAEAEHTYRLGVAQAWVTAPSGTAAARDAWVKGETAGLRLVRDLAVGMEKSALEAQRSRRAQLSAVQSLAAAYRSEAEALRYGPEMTP